MLALTRKADYALLALVHLARDHHAVFSAREIADTYQVPVPLLMNILKTLARNGMVASVRGARGGYRLAMSPGDISLHMVVRAIEGPVRLFQCATEESGAARRRCEHQSACPVSSPARKVSGRLCELLDQITVDELMHDGLPDRRPSMMGTGA